MQHDGNPGDKSLKTVVFPSYIALLDYAYWPCVAKAQLNQQQGEQSMKIIQSIVMGLAMLGSAMAWAGPININSADASALAEGLQGVGEKRAQAIVAYRQANGPFQSIDGLTEVKGIGESIIEKNRGNLTVGE